VVIGNDRAQLRIERLDPDPHTSLEVEARFTRDDGIAFRALQKDIYISSGERNHAALREFAELRTNHMQLVMTEDGLLDLRREAHGHIDVAFTLGYRRGGGPWTLQGVVRVEGEHTQQFLRDLQGLLLPNT
jgi:hypothetical protein